MKSLKAGIKLTGFALWCLIIVPAQMTVRLFTKGPALYILPQIWHRNVCRMLGIRFTVQGTPALDGPPVLFMCNHLSYLDIPLIGSILRASFLAKKEVRSWPVFGFLSSLQNTEFIERKRTAIGQSTKSLETNLQSGKSLIIFPEGTSTDGQTVREFKSSLFSLALGAASDNVQIQPMTIRVDRVDGRPPKTQNLRDLYAWHVDMTTDLPAHLWSFLKTGGADLTLIFHEPINPKRYKDRKTLAKTCHKRVCRGLEQNKRKRA